MVTKQSFPGNCLFAGLPALCMLLLLALAAPVAIWSCTPDTDSITLSGVVVDSTGAPLAGIEVQIQNLNVVSNHEGMFLIEHLQPVKSVLHMCGETGCGRYSVDLSDSPYRNGSAPESPMPQTFTYPVHTHIVFLHDNDLHFHFDHMEAFVDSVQSIRERYENVWLVNTGDNITRHAHRWPEPFDTTFYRDRSEWIIDTMNRIEYDLSVPGNHELAYIADATLNALQMAEFLLLAANLDIATAKLPRFEAHTVLQTANGLNIAVLGLAVDNTGREGVTQRDPVETALAYRNLAIENDVFVALTHIGFAGDTALAEAVPELDLIIGGHSHTLLENARLINGVLVAQAGGAPHEIIENWPKFLGKVVLELVNDRVINKYGEVMIIGDLPDFP